jgi:hypothetical protein
LSFDPNAIDRRFLQEICGCFLHGITALVAAMATSLQTLWQSPIVGGSFAYRVDDHSSGAAFTSGEFARLQGLSFMAIKSAPPSNSVASRSVKWRCAVVPSKTEKKTLLHDLYEQQKQSPWYDNLQRPVTILEPLIKSGVRGVTSNPTIFEKAIAGSNAYDDQFRQLIREGKSVEDAYWALVVQDIQEACDLFQPLYNESNGGDGYISLEVSPLLANETQQTIESAKYLHNVVNRPNVLIKIPATLECIESIKQVIASSISVNVTVSTDIFVTCHNIS